jgi:hypothetical protein
MRFLPAQDLGQLHDAASWASANAMERSNPSAMVSSVGSASRSHSNRLADEWTRQPGLEAEQRPAIDGELDIAAEGIAKGIRLGGEEATFCGAQEIRRCESATIARVCLDFCGVFRPRFCVAPVEVVRLG